MCAFDFLISNCSSTDRRVQKIFNVICDGSLALPAPMEVLRLRVEHVVARFSLQEQHQILARLCRLYPGMREVEMGGESDSW